MRIEDLTCRNFRNLDAVELRPVAGVNVVWGDNGQGKTNLLEGIYLFAYFKSFRGAGNADLLGRAGESARFALRTRRDELERKIELTLTAQGRSFLLDGKAPRPLISMLDALRAVLFAPDELQQLRTVPAARRALLDRAVFQLDPGYLAHAVEYERILRQRNRLLREKPDAATLRPWTEALSRSGATVRCARSGFLARLEPVLLETHRLLTGAQEIATIAYPATGTDSALQEQLLGNELLQVAGRELRVGQSCAGPHRDDPVFLLNEQPIRHLASQGQWRTLVLSYKIALLRLLHEQLGSPPVLLLDDMAAELDRVRQGRLFDLLSGCGAQVFLTTTDPGPIRRLGLDRVAYFQITAGRVEPGAMTD